MQITCDRLTIELGHTEIVRDLSLKAAPGAFIGVIGPNGSGKSTLLKCIYRVLKAKSGCVYLNEEELESLTYKESAQQLGVVTQHNYYNFDFKVSEVVLMGRAPHKKQMERDNTEDYAIVYDALGKVDMYDFKDRVFSTLSGGEQQRIILARALAQRTKCLILDEPTNHLDIKHQLQIMELSKKLGVTVVAALHDLNIAATYCDYLYMLKEGQVVAEGLPRKVLTEEIIGSVYDIRAKIIEDVETSMYHIAYLPNIG
ncbi:MAG: ABC transporter ATP-binding protein [Clostridia bacterium]|nr:ABC transporter ATP-binding protein [Clostridia bacterium]